jgi:hypothetical protein
MADAQTETAAETGVPMWQKGAAGMVVLVILAVGAYASGMIGGDTPEAPDGNTYMKPGTDNIDEVPSSAGDTSVSVTPAGDTSSVSIDMPPLPDYAPVDTTDVPPSPEFDTYVPPPDESGVLGIDEEVAENVPDTKPKLSSDEIYKLCVTKGRDQSRACTGEEESAKQGVGGKWTSTNMSANHVIGCGIYARLKDRSVPSLAGSQCMRLCDSMERIKGKNNCNYKLGTDDGLSSEMVIDLCGSNCSVAGGRRKWPKEKNVECITACLDAEKLDGGKTENFMGFDLSMFYQFLIVGVIIFVGGPIAMAMIAWWMARSQGESREAWEERIEREDMTRRFS